MAESSLTVPNVGAVVDFGMHRVNEYDDEERTFVCERMCFCSRIREAEHSYKRMQKVALQHEYVQETVT